MTLQSYKERKKQYFEENFLDGDKVNDCGGSLIRADVLWGFISDLIDEIEKTYPSERNIPIRMAGWAKNRDTGFNHCLQEIQDNINKL